MKLFVDDIRKLPDESWSLARTVSEAIRAINMFDFEVISLDHDIEGSKETFDTVALFLAEKYKCPIIGTQYTIDIINRINPRSTRTTEIFLRQNGEICLAYQLTQCSNFLL